MSLVTRCPACATAFKVVRDQLRISDGWVRCGRCSQVFDASADLQQLPEPGSADAPAGAPRPEAAAVHAGNMAGEASRSEPEPATEPASGRKPEAQPEAEAASAYESESESRSESESVPDLDRTPAAASAAAVPVPAADAALTDSDFFDDGHDSGLVPLSAMPAQVPPAGVHWPDPDSLLLGDEGRTAVRPPPAPPLSFPDIDLQLPPGVAKQLAVAASPSTESGDVDQAQLQKALRRARVKSAKIAKARSRARAGAAAELPPAVVLSASETEPGPSSTAVKAGASNPLPDFMGGTDAPSAWQRPPVRRALAMLAGLGALLLIVQVLHHQRDLVAARQPALRPLLEGLCRVGGCELSALRQIDDIKIDGASFARARSGEGFQLDFTLRNGAALPLAMPAVELTLLDTQERAVVRRVLLPADFGAPAVLPARAERSASLSLSLAAAEAAALPPVAGFHIEALYP